MFFETPKTYYKQQYCETIDIVVTELHARFQQNRGMSLAALLEKTLLDAANGSFSTLPTQLEIYNHDINTDRLIVQLKMFPELIRTYNEQNPTTCIKEVTLLSTLSEIMNAVESSKKLFSEVRTLLQIVHTIPVTSATAERTFSVLRRLKTFLRSSMLQSRLNNCMILHVHKDKTDQIDLISVAKEFITKCERRRSFFGIFDS